VRPARAFDPANGRWGALQIVARVATLTVDRDAFATFAASGSSREAKQFTLGANWYPNAYIKFYGTFERTTFDGSAPNDRPAEDVIIFRGQVAF
jgi:phosphate-selective porin OprO/OprP